MRRISWGVTRFVLTMASSVAPSRGSDRLWRPRKTRTYVRSAAPLPGVALDLASAIALSLPRPCRPPGADRGLGGVAAPSARPVVRVKPRAVYRDMRSDAGVAGRRVR